MTEFKQIIGRGTRVRDDYGKLFFNILDYTGSATRLFADPDFDGEPAVVTEEDDRRAGRAGRRGAGRRGAKTPSRRTTKRRDRRHRAAARRRPSGRAPQVLRRRRPGRDRRPPGLRARPRRQAAPRREVHRLHRREGAHAVSPTPPSCAREWADPDSARDDHRGAGRARHRLRGPRRSRPTSPTPTRSTCSATWPSTRRCAPAASGRSACAASSKDFFEQYGPEARADPRRAARQVHRARRGAVRHARRA